MRDKTVKAKGRKLGTKALGMMGKEEARVAKEVERRIKASKPGMTNEPSPMLTGSKAVL